MKGWPRPILAAALLLALSACATAGGGAGGAHSDRHRIDTLEIQATGQSDAYSVVQALRPHWLRARGVSSINMGEQVMVYLDGMRMGGPEALRQISARSITSIRYYDGVAATQEWGLDHGSGAIAVTTRD